MRISEALACAVLAAAIGVAVPALAFDAKPMAPDTAPADALRFGLNAFKSGDTSSVLSALNFAADKGLASARWKLAQLYATGDGVPRDPYKAFQLFGVVANMQADAGPRDPAAPYVSNAFVQLGSYYRSGIAGSPLRANPSLARQYFSYAASYFGDASAQLYLARMLYVGE